jgi:hypothetical protein
VRLLYGHDALVCDWVARRIPGMAPAVANNPPGRAFGAATAIGVVDGEGCLRGGVIYHNYRPEFRTIELGFASAHRRWLTRSLINGLLAYPFDQLGCQRVTGVTPKRYKDARRFLDKFGFKREGVVRRGFGDDDAIISGLLRSEWDRSPWNARSAEALNSSAILSRGSIVRQRRAKEWTSAATPP